jgi:SAM-dependent methyltransferase
VDERSFQTKVATSSQDVLAFYDAYAATWDERFGTDQTVGRFHRMRLESLLRIANFKSTDDAIEFGVGSGPYVRDIAPRVRTLRCVDGAAGMLRVLESKHRGVSNLIVEQIDLERPIEPSHQKADIVYWFGLIEHIIDVPAFLENCRSILKPGGRVVFAAPNGRCPWYGALRRLWRVGAHCTSDHYYTPEECDALFARFGFRRDGLIYWGYAPAGVPSWLYSIFNAAGAVIGNTPLRKYAGGMTLGYVLSA